MNLEVVTLRHTKYDIMQSLNRSDCCCTSLTIDSCFFEIRKRQTKWFYKTSPFFLVFTRIPQLLLNKCNWNWPGFISDKNKSTIKSHNKLIFRDLAKMVGVFIIYYKPSSLLILTVLEMTICKTWNFSWNRLVWQPGVFPLLPMLKMLNVKRRPKIFLINTYALTIILSAAFLSRATNQSIRYADILGACRYAWKNLL